MESFNPCPPQVPHQCSLCCYYSANPWIAVSPLQIGFRAPPLSSHYPYCRKQGWWDSRITPLPQIHCPTPCKQGVRVKTGVKGIGNFHSPPFPLGNSISAKRKCTRLAPFLSSPFLSSLPKLCYPFLPCLLHYKPLRTAFVSLPLCHRWGCLGLRSHFGSLTSWHVSHFSNDDISLRIDHIFYIVCGLTAFASFPMNIIFSIILLGINVVRP